MYKNTNMQYQEITIKDLTFRLVLIPAGSFMMGGDKYEREQPIHQVSIPAFWMAEYPCTQALYEAVTGENPSYFKGANRPVERVSWDDIKEVFLPKLCQLTGKPFRLPSEAEWEYAAKGENQPQPLPFPKGEGNYPLSIGEGAGGGAYEYAGSNNLHEVGWYDENSHEETKPVGLKKPNDFGLYDLSGNVWEWCEDDWHGSYAGAPTDGRAWIDNPRGSNRMQRGGSWGSNADYCRRAYRTNYGTGNRLNGIGFRLVLPQFGG
jgi:formylglycine-generating enzyme required for sulfatase activity